MYSRFNFIWLILLFTNKAQEAGGRRVDDQFFELYRPDYVLVHGDTATTVTAAISAHYFHIPIVHIEAGLRTKDHDWSWP